MNFARVRRKLRSLSWRRRPFDEDARIALGVHGERAAVRHLRRRGYRIIARNYDSPFGEVDLIATQGATIVFVEVKSRSGDPEQGAEPSVGAFQRDRIIRAARYFVQRGRADHRPVRFDVVTVRFGSKGKPSIEHFEDAFRPMPLHEVL